MADFWILCKHAASAIKHKRGNLEEYCDQAFTKDVYLLAHVGMIHPIPRLWEVVRGDTVKPPPLRRLPGRPRKNRIKEADEPIGNSNYRRSNTLGCSICQNFGHNKRSWQRAPVKGKKQLQEPKNRWCISIDLFVTNWYTLNFKVTYYISWMLRAAIKPHSSQAATQAEGVIGSSSPPLGVSSIVFLNVHFIIIYYPSLGSVPFIVG